MLEPTTVRVSPLSDDKLATPAAMESHSPDVSSDAAALYVEHRALLLFIATRRFGVPDCDSENLLQDVFVSYLQAGTRIQNVRAWLVAAVCNASRHYWRVHGRIESLPDDLGERIDPASQRLPDLFALQITVQQALRYLAPRCQETLRLHYFEGRSANDVAEVLETTSRYAEKLIHNCLKRAREIYTRITAVMR